MKRLLAALLLLVAPAALAAPADDGQTAAARQWILNSGRYFVAVTPDDSNDLVPAPTRWLITSGTGGGAACVLNFRGADNGTTAVTMTLNPNVMYAIQVKRVLATSTTCLGVVAIY